MARARRTTLLASFAYVASFAIVIALGSTGVSCGAGDFDAPSKLNTVRILASRADKPYAAPGDDVTIDLLAYDARKDKTRPMKIFWIPLLCVNPPGDLYYLCFAQFLGKAGGDAGAGGDGGGAPNPALALLRPGVDLSPFLPTGPTYTFKMPADIIDAHPIVQGSPEPYGLAILFNIACAGHIEITAQNPDDLRKQQVPLGCFDENHQQLPASDYVIGITRVYAYRATRNANPVIDHVTYQGQPVDLAAGLSMDRCDNVKHRVDCPELKLNVVVPDSSWEVNPADTPSGKLDDPDKAHEQVWVDYYGSIGDFAEDARLLYDSHAGAVTDNDAKYFASQQPGDGRIFVVVHDNRGGASWAQFPVHVR